jgi:hypothetical protein
MRFLAVSIFILAAAAGAASAGDMPKPGSDPEADRRHNHAAALRFEVESQKEAQKYQAAQRILKLERDSAECIALRKEGDDCLLTTAAFNREAGVTEPEDADLAGNPARVREIRASLLRLLLRPAYLQDRLAETGLQRAVLDSGSHEEERVWSAAAARVGEVRLRELYRRHRALFAAQESRVYQVLAATDSAWIDSVARLASAPATASAPGRHSIDSLPWRLVPDTALPRSLADSGRVLRKWKCSRSLVFAAGHAVIRPVDIRRSPEDSYEQALPFLINLSQYQPLDSAAAEREALAYYKSHPKEFAAPDTLAVETRLTPVIPAQGAPIPTAIRITNLDLPADIRGWLEARDSLRAGRAYGPIVLGLGAWHLRVLEIRQGHGGLAYAQARDSLLARLESGRVMALLRQSWADANAKRRDRGMRILEEMLAARSAPTEAEVAQAVATDTSIAKALPPDTKPANRAAYLKLLAGFRLRERARDNEFAEWLETKVTVRGL